MSVVGISVGSGDTPRAVQPVATFNPTTGAIVTPPSSATAGDAAANPTTSQDLSYVFAYNGTTWDRVRTIPGLSGTGVGAVAVGPVGKYTGTLPTLAEGTYGALQVNSNAVLMVTQADPVNRPALFTTTRPADVVAYAAATATAPGDLMANSTTAGSVVPMSWTIAPFVAADTARGLISQFQLDVGFAFTGTIRVEFFNIQPTVTNGDNGAYAVSNTTLDNRLGYADIAMTPNGKGGSSGGSDTIRLAYQGTAAGNFTLYALLQSITAITPTSGATFVARPTLLRTT